MTNREVLPIIVPNQYGLRSVNFYLVKNNDTLSLIDAGYPDESCWEAFQDTLKNHHLHLSDLTEIILTHHHVDHVGLVNQIIEQHPIPIYASPLAIPRLIREEKFMEMRVNFFSDLYRQMGCGEMGEKQVSYLVKSIKKNKDRAIKGEIVEITEPQLLHFDVIEVPGHAPDQLAFWDKKENWLFVGDLLIEHISSNALVEPDEHGKRLPSLTDQIDSLRKILQLDIDVIFSGHGEVIRNPKALIEKRLKRIEEKATLMTELIQSGYKTGSALAQKMYKSKYEKEFGLVMSEVIGHLDYLESQNRIEKTLVQGVWWYGVK